ncbi:MAG: zinc ribbon domain-containing protein [Melioribacteraceae bacterium]|nr:zinc ribbon domain-containing protein [Melioribacteraceae bacterium]
MPSYDFHCEKCNEDVVLVFSMKDEDGRKNAKCEKCSSKLRRVFNATSSVIKTNNPGIQVKPHQKLINVDGKPVMLNFIDHGNRTIQNNSLLKSIPGASIDEKTGRPVVRIASSIPDPLGALERSKRNSTIESITKNVNQKVKIRK